jgi:hypothetical protein
MFIKNYNLQDQFSELVKVGASPGVLKRSENEKANLLIWQQAMMNEGIARLMADMNWPQKLLRAMPSSEGWDWKLHTLDGETSDVGMIFNAVSKATGSHNAKPQGNVHVTLELRAYDQEDHYVGSKEWWEANEKRLQAEDLHVTSFFKKLFSILGTVRDNGADFCVEQMSIIISKDSDSPLSTLTSTLHSDEFYGPWETAICSLLEDGYEQNGGGMFVPSQNMKALWELRPIYLDTIQTSIGIEHPIVMTNSGDIANYGGMIGLDGTKDTCNGVPHISSDEAGKTSRLVILMRNRPQVLPIADQSPALH